MNNYHDGLIIRQTTHEERISDLEDRSIEKLSNLKYIQREKSVTKSKQSIQEPGDNNIVSSNIWATEDPEGKNRENRAKNINLK